MNAAVNIKSIGLILLSWFVSMQVLYAQELTGRVVDSKSKEGIPFVKLTKTNSKGEQIAGIRGYFKIDSNATYAVKHPLYEDQNIEFPGDTDTVIFELVRKESVITTSEQLEAGAAELNNYHDNLLTTMTTYQAEFDFLSSTHIAIYEQSKTDPDHWALLNSLESLEKNRFKYPDKKYSRVVESHFSDGDSSILGFIPINTYSVSPTTEYISAAEQKYYNPQFKGADKRYEYALMDTFLLRGDTIRSVFFRPIENKRFVGFTGMLYFANDRSALWGGYLLPFRKYKHDFFIAFFSQPTSRDTRFLSEVHVALRLKDIPNLSRNSIMYYNSKNSSPSFDVKSTSEAKWVNMAIFNYQTDTTADDTWMMTQMVDKEKLEYIKKDTTDREFVLSNTLRWMYNIYDGKIGYRLRFFDLKNEFAINRFESVRIGIGLQSHENLSDVFTFGGYFAYGIGDGKFKYGANVGVFLDASRTNLLSLIYTRDLQEPGQVRYLQKKQDLVRDFFTSRMDDYFSTKISFRSKINAYLTSQLLFDNYSLKPLYDYIYNPNGEEINEIQNFNFTETSLLLNVGTPFANNPNIRNILYRKKKIRSNLFLNITKGWSVDKGGDYDYWKLNGRLSSNIRIKKKHDLDIVLDGGVMTRNQPYQINYVGPGTEFKLTGIIINNAFQSMKLYGFFSDRYVHSFMTYNIGDIFETKAKFNPDLAFALNVGWGKISGSKEIHENIEVEDYVDGYYEAGVLLNNLLRLKIYNYFYGGLGIGTYYGFGPESEDGAFAFRISYEIGVL